MEPLSEYADCNLIKLLEHGNEAAFNEIYNRYWVKLYNECYKRLKDEALSADIIQDIFADVWIKRGSKHIENLGAYLHSAARYHVFLLYKKNKHIAAFEEPIEMMAIESRQADSVFHEKELRECIAIWLEMQPQKRREVFRLKFAEDLSTKEISEKLNVSQKTVQNQFSTSLSLLRSHLGKLLSILV
jgi:RNA polymerase sigma-70 factor (ECF subfamily)